MKKKFITKFNSLNSSSISFTFLNILFLIVLVQLKCSDSENKETNIKPQISILENQHDYLSAAGGYSTSRLTWKSGESGKYEIKTSGNCEKGCDSSGTNAKGDIHADKEIVSVLKAGDLYQGENTIHICVKNTDSVTIGDKSYTIIRDDILPATPHLRHRRSGLSECCPGGWAACDQNCPPDCH